MPLYDENDIPSLDKRINGAFNYKSEQEMEEILDKFIEDTGLDNYKARLSRGMFLAQSPFAYRNRNPGGHTLGPEEKRSLEFEDVPVKTPGHMKSARVWTIDFKKWNNISPQLWRLVLLCALGAVVQGWDQAAVNGAQKDYLEEFNQSYEENPRVVGLINSAPYLACVLSFWLSPWLNRHFGRRGAIFWTAIFSAAFALAQAFSQSWEVLFVFRFLMGLGIGPKSVTVPIYAAECSPANVRGSLVMLWQLFTAVGIMLGTISGVAFHNVGKNNWRFILASPMVAPIILAAYIYTQHESPRWLIHRGHQFARDEKPNSAKVEYQKAWEAFQKLRLNDLQASRDMFDVFHRLRNERQELSRASDTPGRRWKRKGFLELLTVPRNRRATIASLVCMFAQQFCGVNVIVYGKFCETDVHVD